MITLGRKHAWRDSNRQVVVPFPQTVAEEMKATDDAAVTVVAYHTNDDFYSNEARRMCASAARLGIDVKTTVVPSQGDWVKNTSFKSAYLQSEREAVRGPMLYVDVDAVFHRSPLAYLAELDCDVAAYYDLGDGHLVSATLFLQDTPAVKQLLAEWHRQCQARPDVWDQQVLQDILDADQAQTTPQYRIHRLPVGFCWIFDREDNLRAGQQAVYIEQLQAGRAVSEAVRTKGKLFSLRKSRVQRRIDRVLQIEQILFSQIQSVQVD